MTYDPVAAATNGAVRAYNVTHLDWVMLGLTVVDDDGAPLAGAEVTVDGVTYTTPASGRVSVQLAAGEYEVDLALTGYDPHSITYTMDRWREEVEAMYPVVPPRVISTVAASVTARQAVAAVATREASASVIATKTITTESEGGSREITTAVAVRTVTATVEVK